jgi:low affinity Fe/Cu permease
MRNRGQVNLKLDELIYSISSAKDQMIDIEKLSDKDLEELSKRYEKIRQVCLDRKGRSSDAIDSKRTP